MTRIGEHGGGYFRLLSPRRFPLARTLSSPEVWLIAGFTGLLVVSMVVEGGRATYAAALAIGGLVAVVGLFLPERLILLLPPLALLSGWTIQAGGLNVRLDQAMAVLLGPSLLLHLALGRVRLPLARPMLFVLAFLAVNLLASLFSGSPKKESVSHPQNYKS